MQKVRVKDREKREKKKILWNNFGTKPYFYNRIDKKGKRKRKLLENSEQEVLSAPTFSSCGEERRKEILSQIIGEVHIYYLFFSSSQLLLLLQSLSHTTTLVVNIRVNHT